MKNLKYIVICLSLFSCKSQQLSIYENESHNLLAKVLKVAYRGQDKNINLEIYTREIDSQKLGQYIHAIKLISKADSSIYIDTEWFNDFYDYNKLISESNFMKWNPKKIDIENLNTQFKLTQKDNQRYLKEMIERDSLNYRKAYEMKVVFWVKENGTYNIISSTCPVFSNNQEKALVFTSIYHGGLTAWLFEKQENHWKIITNLTIAFY